MKASRVSEHLDNGCSSAAPTSPSQICEIFQESLAPIFRKKRPFSNSGSIEMDQRGKSLKNSGFSATNSGSSNKASGERAKRAKGAQTSTTANASGSRPLSEVLRPGRLEDFVGQEHLLGSQSAFRMHIKQGTLPNSIFWGPPGTGKTSLAKIIASEVGASFKELSATSAGVGDVRKVMEEAASAMTLARRRTILFLDEIHRFSRSQQDILLPFVEAGTVLLIGATTENPSFKIISPLLSRCRVFKLNQLDQHDIKLVLRRALNHLIENLEVSNREQSTLVAQNNISRPLHPAFPNITDETIDVISSFSLGDARTAISILEYAAKSPPQDDQGAFMIALKQTVVSSYDREGEAHHDSISALHKSIRNSDGDAAMFWLARMLIGDEDPVFIARRLVVMASEDIGLASENALPLATSTLIACQNVGMPECRINLAHCVAYLAEASKSTRSYVAYEKAAAAARQHRTLPIPLNIRNAPTKLMKDFEYGEGYNYNPSYCHPVHNACLPQDLENEKYLLNPDEYEQSKNWDEKLLRTWENLRNGGKPWEGRLP